jgi:uncharacterized peroxidase-related enzyme
MRLTILNTGYSFGIKFLFGFIRIMSRYPLPDAAKIIFYRPDFYGSLMKKVTQLAMRGTSEWSVAERELMAAYISKLNNCEFCIKAHVATSSMAYKDEAKVQKVLADLETAPIAEPLRAILRLLEKLTKGQTVNADDIRKVKSVGVSTKQIKDALAVCFAFNITNRLANTFEFEVLNQKAMESGAKYLLFRGYK